MNRLFINRKVVLFLTKGIWFFIFWGIQNVVLLAQQGPFYPRIGVFHWSGAPPEWYAQFGLIITANRSRTFAEAVKKINPNTYVLATTDWNVGSELSIPDEWVVKDSKGNRIMIYGGAYKLVDMSDYCLPSSKYGGKKYNEYLIDHMTNYCDLTVFDGVASCGVWEYPFGTTDVDLDRNGVNDWEEHGKNWLISVWSKGLNKAVAGIRARIGPNKLISLNSGRFHTFEWRTTNGLISEHASINYSWKSHRTAYRDWMAAAPYPHIYLLDGKGTKKNDFYWMRFLLGLTLYGDGYFSYSDANSSEHHYDKYCDEFDVDLGYPKGAMQSLFLTGQDENGVWVRFFDRGAVIVNIDNKANTITNGQISTLSGYDGPYYRFKGGQDPQFNNGQPFSDVTLKGSVVNTTGLVGDAIILVKNPTTVVSDIVIDNVDAGTSPASEPAKLVGNWQSLVKNNAGFWTMGGREYRGIYDYAVAQPGSGTTYAEFRPTIGVAGNYEVFEWHGWIGNTADELQEATNVPFTVTYAKNSTASGTINQSVDYGKWNSLGTYYFDAGSGGNVTIRNNANGMVLADAFKFVYKGSTTDTQAPNEPRQLRSENTTENSITLRWSVPLAASDGDTATAYQVFRNKSLLGTPIKKSFMDTDLSENTTYLYEVYTQDDAGNRSPLAATANFTTTADTRPPELVTVRIVSLTSLQVMFSEKMEQASSENFSNYRIESGVTVTAASLLENLKTVELTTSPHIVGVPYTLVVNNVRDRAVVPNTIRPNSSFNYVGGSGDTLKVVIAADNAYELYVNGALIGSNDNWGTAQIYLVPAVTGKNLIAVKGIDLGGEGGLVAEIDYKGQHFVTNETWKVATTKQEGWETLTFNDVVWQKATSYGLHGVALPWAKYSNVKNISTNSGVHWIWSSDYNNDNIVYFRLALGTGGDLTPPSPPKGIVVTKK